MTDPNDNAALLAQSSEHIRKLKTRFRAELSESEHDALDVAISELATRPAVDTPDGGGVGFAVPGTCPLPPEGWFCTLADGHGGPCPTWPASAATTRSRADQHADAVVRIKRLALDCKPEEVVGALHKIIRECIDLERALRSTTTPPPTPDAVQVENKWSADVVEILCSYGFAPEAAAVFASIEMDEYRHGLCECAELDPRDMADLLMDAGASAVEKWKAESAGRPYGYKPVAAPSGQGVCPVCKGEGGQRFMALDGKGDEYEQGWECAACDGFGRANAAPSGQGVGEDAVERARAAYKAVKRYYSGDYPEGSIQSVADMDRNDNDAWRAALAAAGVGGVVIEDAMVERACQFQHGYHWRSLSEAERCDSRAHMRQLLRTALTPGAARDGGEMTGG